MFPCCELCYSKYITKDNRIDYEGYILALYEYSSHTVEAIRQRINKGYGIKKIRISKRPFEHICTCKCHKDGLEVLH